jgi:putative transposase
MAIEKEIVDRLLADYRKPEDLTGENGLLRQLTKALMERALESEMATHLGYEKHDQEAKPNGNRRNGKSKKTLKGEFGEIEVITPRDREATFEPQIIPKGQTRMAGLDGKILSMYARGMTTRDIQGHLEEMYGVEVSPTLISNVTDAVLDEVRAWQNRPLDAVYPIVYLDALVVKMREEGTVQNRAVYVAIGITMEGHKEVLGLWTSANEGAKFWLSVLNDLKTRGVEDIFIACVDGLKGFPQAIEAGYPKTTVQLCIVHMVRASLRFVSWKDAKAVVADLKMIYRGVSRENAEQQLEVFAAKWDPKYRSISQLWRRHWEQIVPFFAFPTDIRKVIYTTNAVESLNMTLRKLIKTRGSFPNEDAAIKLLYLALMNVAKKWHTIQGWPQALNHFAILWGDRFPERAR